MRLIKNKQFTLLLSCLVLLVGFLLLGGMHGAKVSADPHVSCTPPATAVFPANGDPSYCTCPKGSVVDATTDPNTCTKTCPQGTVVVTQHGQDYCNQQLQCPDGTDAPNNNVNQCDSFADPAAQCTKSSCDLFKKYLNPAINLLSALVGLVVVGSVIAGAIQYSASEGDPQKAAKAKDRIMNSVIALVAFIFLFAFLQWLIPGGILNK